MKALALVTSTVPFLLLIALNVPFALKGYRINQGACVVIAAMGIVATVAIARTK